MAEGTAELARHVEAVVREVAERLSSPERIETALRQLREESDLELHYDPYVWDVLSLGGGATGICLLIGAMDQLEPEQGWDVRGHAFLVEIQQVMQRVGARSHSLWGSGGLCGIGMAVRALSRGGTRYQQLSARVRDVLLQTYSAYLGEARQRLKTGVRASDYDVIEGWAGVGRYLLLDADRPEVRAALEDVLRYLVELSADQQAEGQTVPGWHIPVELQVMEYDKTDYPKGNFNMGLAHGIPGPLALLAVALQQGIEVAGQREAIRRICDWLLQFKQEDEHGSFWVGRIAWEEQLTGVVDAPVDRGAWCYGTPGVARALWLAGEACGEEGWKRLAVESYQGIFLRGELWRTPAPTFCHGLGGLLQLTQRIYADSKDERLRAPCDELVELVLQAYQDEAPFGFPDRMPVKGRGYQDVHKPGLLEGAAGTALVLLGQLQEEAQDWDAAIMIV